jgi:hypothetical protein
MAEVKVKVVAEFFDRTEDLVLRKRNETLTVTEERAKMLIGLGLAKKVETEVPKPAPKKRTTKIEQ